MYRYTITAYIVYILNNGEWEKKLTTYSRKELIDCKCKWEAKGYEVKIDTVEYGQ